MWIPTPWYRGDYDQNLEVQRTPHFDIFPYHLWVLKTRLSLKLAEIFSPLPEAVFSPHYEESTGRVRMMVHFILGTEEVEDPRLPGLVEEVIGSMPEDLRRWEGVVLPKRSIPYSDEIITSFLQRRAEFLFREKLRWNGQYFSCPLFSSASYISKSLQLRTDILNYLEQERILLRFYE